MSRSREFADALARLGWGDARASASLEVDAGEVERWRSGAVEPPADKLRALLKLVDIHAPGASRAEWSRTTSREYSTRVDNPHDNWHGEDVHRAQERAEYDERARRAREQARQQAAEDVARAGVDHVPEPGSEAELVASLARLRTSFDALAGAYAALRAEYARATGSEPPELFLPHDIVGVRADATWAQIRERYRARSRELHPDMGGDLDEMQRLSAAYAELKALFER